MTIAKLAEIPCIAVKEKSDTRITIRAADGFRLDAERLAGYWRFDPKAKVFHLTHFDLRKRINEALNP